MLQYAIDWWTLYHTIGWGLAAYVAARSGLGLRPILCFSLLGGLAWEALEWAAVEPALGFCEPWVNRLVTDPLADVAGGYLGATLWRYHGRSAAQ